MVIPIVFIVKRVSGEGSRTPRFHCWRVTATLPRTLPTLLYPRLPKTSSSVLGSYLGTLKRSNFSFPDVPFGLRLIYSTLGAKVFIDKPLQLIYTLQLWRCIDLAMKKNIMISMSENQFLELEKLSKWLGTSKSKVIQQSLLIFAAQIKEVSGDALDKIVHQ